MVTEDVHLTEDASAKVRMRNHRLQFGNGLVQVADREIRVANR